MEYFEYQNKKKESLVAWMSAKFYYTMFKQQMLQFRTVGLSQMLLHCPLL